MYMCVYRVQLSLGKTDKKGVLKYIYLASRQVSLTLSLSEGHISSFRKKLISYG